MNSTAHRPADALAVSLAGLQAGMIGTCWMLAWLGLSAMGQHRGFWTAENLMASVFHPDAAIRRGFGFSTLSGIALYLLVYSLLGAGFALAVRNRFTNLGTVLFGLLFSIGWYWLWFRALGQTVMPLVWLLHAENSTVFGHAIFGASIARFPAYLPKLDPPAAEPPAEGNPLPEKVRKNWLAGESACPTVAPALAQQRETDAFVCQPGDPNGSFTASDGRGSDGEQPVPPAPAPEPAAEPVPPDPDLS